MKLLDKLVDILINYLMKYKTYRKIQVLKKRDPFIYH